MLGNVQISGKLHFINTELLMYLYMLFLLFGQNNIL